MKLALVTDLHCDKKCIGYLGKIIRQENPDTIVCSGDITTRDNIEYLKEVFDILKKNKLPGFFIWGNADQKNVQQAILKSEYNIHLDKKLFGGFSFFGLSYLEDYPEFDTSQIKDSIFVTHQPPIKQNLEMKSLNSPKFHISGHLHKAAFVKKYPSIIHIQVPTLMDGRYGLFDPSTKAVDFKNI